MDTTYKSSVSLNGKTAGCSLNIAFDSIKAWWAAPNPNLNPKPKPKPKPKRLFTMVTIALYSPWKLQGALFTIILIIFGAFWMYRALEDMLSIIVSNSHFGKRSTARVMTICSLHFLPNITNIVFLVDEILLTRPPGHLQG